MSTLKIVVSSTRPGRIGAPIARWVADRARALSAFDRVELLDLAEIALPLFDEPHHPRTGNYTRPHTKAWAAAVAEADALIITTPEYNHSFPATIKNALDYLHAEWRDKALGLVGYGGVSGGRNAVQALTPVTDALGLVQVEPITLVKAMASVVEGEFLGSGKDAAAVDTMIGRLAELDRELASRRSEAALAS